MLITISAVTNSNGRSGLIIRLPMLRAHISSRNEIEKPSWPAKQDVPQQHRADQRAAGAGKKPAFCVT